MLKIDKLFKRLDELQYRNRFIGFVVAVIRHYSNNQDGNRAALLTYYSFMSLFPLLLWLVFMANWLNQFYPGTSAVLVHGATQYFPVLGSQLSGIAQSAHRALPGVIISGLVALYGARGMASVFQSAVNDIWEIPKSDRRKFPANWLTSMGTVIFGGSGFMLSAIISSWALSREQGGWYSLMVGILNIATFAAVFMLILRLSLPTKTRLNKVVVSALSMAVAMSLLQLAGGFIVTHDLKTYTNSYTVLFAVTLGLLAWIYLQAQILLYAIEASIVHSRRIWPIKLIG